MCKSSLLWRLAGLVVLLSLLVTSATSAAPVKVAPATKVVLMGPVGATSADDSPPPPPAHNRARMIVLCDKLSGSVLEEAVRRNLCPSANSNVPLGTTLNRVTPEDRRYGDCGWSELYVDDADPNPGEAVFIMAVSSSQGAIVQINWWVNWTNWSTRNTGGFGRTDYLFSSYWSRVEYRTTGTGDVTATLAGVVTLWWGGMCNILYPSDDAYID